MIKKLCVFCGSSAGKRPAYAASAKELGRCMAGRGITLVFGGGGIGLMGILADAVLEGGGRIEGVIPGPMLAAGWGHRKKECLHVVEGMHERKAEMMRLSDAAVAMPGGIGTLEEIAEVMAWVQLGLFKKPVGLLNTGGYFDPWLGMLKKAEEEGFYNARFLGALQLAAEPAALIDMLEKSRAVKPALEWDSKEAT